MPREKLRKINGYRPRHCENGVRGRTILSGSGQALDRRRSAWERRAMRILTFLTAIAALHGIASAQVTPAERRMAQTVQQEAPRGIELLERLVNQNSGTLNRAGVTEVGRMVRAELEPLGFTVRWVDMADTGRAGHLIAEHRGDGRGKRLLLIGHLDTVFEPSSPFQRFTREGNRAVGPGIGDDKGGIVVIIQALRAMHAAGTLRGADIRIVLTGDEERPGSPIAVARRDLIEAGRWADVALEFEGLATENGRDFGTIARRSSTSWTLRTRGRTGHSSGVFGPGLGYGAIYEMARILDAFRRELSEPNLTYNVGVIGGGTPATIDTDGLAISASGKTNIVAETAIARGDLRSLTREQDARARARMQAIVAQHLPRTQAELVFSEDGYPPMAPTEGNRAVLAALNRVNRDLGLPEMPEYDPARRGAADSGFVAQDVDTLGGLGASGGGAHAEGEYLELDSIARSATRMAILMSRLAREPRQADRRAATR
jgi:glutamate carboxypeptidase